MDITPMRQVYQPDEAEQILTEAVRRTTPASFAGDTPTPTGITHERLVEMAGELGIPLDTLRAVLDEQQVAAQQQEAERTRTLARGEFIQKRRAGFLPHGWAYLGVNGACVLLILAVSLLQDGANPAASLDTVRYMLGFWFVEAISWGLGLFFHAVATLPTRGPVFETQFAQWFETRQRREAQQLARARRRLRRDDKTKGG